MGCVQSLGGARDAVQPLAQQRPLPGGELVGVLQAGEQGDRGPGAAGRGRRLRGIGDTGDDGVASDCGEPQIAFGFGGGNECDDDSAACGVNELDGELLGDPKPAGLRDAVDVALQDSGGGKARGRRRRSVPALAPQQRLDLGVGQAEGKVLVPPGAQILDGIRPGRPARFRRQVGLECVDGDCVEQALLIAEESVDGWRLDPAAALTALVEAASSPSRASS